MCKGFLTLIIREDHSIQVFTCLISSYINQIIPGLQNSFQSVQINCVLHEGFSARLNHRSIIDWLFLGAFKRSYFCTDSKSTLYYRNHQYFVFPKDFDLSGNELTHLNKRMRNKTTMCLWETDTDWPQWPLTKPNNVILSDVSGADRKWSQLYCSDYDIWHKLVSKCCKRQRLTVQNSVQKLR